MSGAGTGGAAELLLRRNPWRAIFSLAAPTTGVMCVAATGNIVYTIFVSRLGTDAIAALALVFPISLIMITVMAGGLGAGVASAVARALGAGRADEARAAAEHGFFVATVLAVICTAALEIGAPVLFSLMGGSGRVLADAVLFARILFAGLLGMFFISTMDSVMRGEGNVRTPALCGTLALVVQTVLAPLLIFVAGLGLAGAPLATLAGQVVGAVPRLRHVFGGRGLVRPRALPRRIRRGDLAEILRVGAPSSLAAGINYAGMVVLTAILARFSTAHLAAFGLGVRLNFTLIALGYGVAAAALTLVGMAAGAGRPDLVRGYALRATAVVVGAVLLPAALVAAWPDVWYSLFTGDAAIHAVGRSYFHWIAPCYPLVLASMVLASCFQALRRADRPLLVTVLRVTFVLTTVVVAIRVFAAGAEAVFAAIAAGTGMGTVLLAWLFIRGPHVLGDVPVRVETGPR